MVTRDVGAALLVLASLLGPALARQPAAQPYRILVTSDEGVRAPGLATVAQTLQAIGDVVIVAPSQPRSRVGHGRVTDEPIVREDLTIPNGLRAVGLSSTPASSVSLAIQNVLAARPDLVVAGIHRGYNLGYEVYASGLAAAAREAAMLGVPAVAASLTAARGPNDLVFAAEEVLGVARRVKQYGLATRTFLNVNIPPMPADGYKGYAVTTQAPAGVDAYRETASPPGRRAYERTDRTVVAAAEGTDVWAVEHGFVSVTPLSLTESDVSPIETLRTVFE